jgi:hypothetical protein
VTLISQLIASDLSKKNAKNGTTAQKYVAIVAECTVCVGRLEESLLGMDANDLENRTQRRHAHLAVRSPSAFICYDPKGPTSDSTNCSANRSAVRFTDRFGDSSGSTALFCILVFVSK